MDYLILCTLTHDIGSLVLSWRVVLLDFFSNTARQCGLHQLVFCVMFIIEQKCAKSAPTMVHQYAKPSEFNTAKMHSKIDYKIKQGLRIERCDVLREKL